MRLFKKSFYLIAVWVTVYLGACSPEQSTELKTREMVEDLRILSADEMQGRQTGTEGNRIAREYILKRYNEIGLRPYGKQFEHEFTFERRGDTLRGVNLLAEIPGSTDSTIVLSAHYDHIGMRDSLIFNGADDNASGVAAIIALGEWLLQRDNRHTFVIAAYDAEEMGKRGAEWWVRNDSLIRSRAVLNINLDMIAQNQEGKLWASGTYHYPELRGVIEGIPADSLTLLFGHDDPDSELDNWTYASDHSAFHRQGIPFLYFGVEDHPHYHKHTDEFSTIPVDFYISAVEFIREAIAAFDRSL